MDAGLSGRELATLMQRHPSKISRIERGTTPPSAADVRTWCGHCRVGSLAEELVADLRTVDTMWLDWRRMERTGLRRAQESVRALHERTGQFRFYSGCLIPGPVQTAPYVRALLSALRDRRRLIDDGEAAVAERMSRQRMIARGDHRLALVLEESALRARIGSPDVMAGQLGHLLSVAALPWVSIGVIPLSADRSGLHGVEMFFRFDDEQVNVELVSGFLTITQPREVAMYAQLFEDLAGQAVYGAAARRLITRAIDTLEMSPSQ